MFHLLTGKVCRNFHFELLLDVVILVKHLVMLMSHLVLNNHQVLDAVILVKHLVIVIIRLAIMMASYLFQNKNLEDSNHPRVFQAGVQVL